MSEVTTREIESGKLKGLWAIDYINGEWATAYGLTKKEAEHYKNNFDYFEIGKKWGWI